MDDIISVLSGAEWSVHACVWTGVLSPHADMEIRKVSSAETVCRSGRSTGPAHLAGHQRSRPVSI